MDEKDKIPFNIPIRQEITVLPADKPRQLKGHDLILPGETVEQARERLKPKGWRWWICWLIYRIPQEWYRREIPCPDGREGCLVAHYEDTRFGKTIGKKLRQITGKWDKRPWIIIEEPGICVINAIAFPKFLKESKSND
jgi:hypothetical protein